MWEESFVRPQKPCHFGAQQSYERSWKHLSGLLGCVLEIVLGVCQDIKQSLDQFLILKRTEFLLPGQNTQTFWHFANGIIVTHYQREVH